MDLICFDPGPHTGVAVFLNEKPYLSTTLEDDLYRRILTIHASFVTPSSPVAIVVENFHTVAALTREGMLTIKLMGWIEGLAHATGQSVAFQMPSMKKAWLDPAKALLKDVTLAPERRGTPHERDALAHGLAWLAKHGASDANERAPEEGSRA